MCHVWAFVEHNERDMDPIWQKMSSLGFPMAIADPPTDDRWIRYRSKELEKVFPLSTEVP